MLISILHLLIQCITVLQTSNEYKISWKHLNFKLDISVSFKYELAGECLSASICNTELCTLHIIVPNRLIIPCEMVLLILRRYFSIYWHVLFLNKLQCSGM